MNNLQFFLLDMLLPIFTAGGLIVGVVFFVIFMGISLTVFFATKKKSSMSRRVWILLGMLLITILGSLGFSLAEFISMLVCLMPVRKIVVIRRIR